MKKETVLIVGGGASGIFCAANLNPEKYAILILEKTGRLLSKVSISGGGRCNVTNGSFHLNSHFAKHYPRGEKWMKKVLPIFNFQATIRWFKNNGVDLKQEADGRIFPCTNRSQTIIDVLLRKMEANAVEIKFHEQVSGVSREKNGYNIICKSGAIYTCAYLVIATGGYPKSTQYEWIKNLGVQIIDPNPSLFTFNVFPKHITELMGVSKEWVKIKITGTNFEAKGAILITHWGFSGPAVLKLSAIAAQYLATKNWKAELSINWIYPTNETQLRENINAIRKTMGNQIIYQKNPFELPQRLWQFLCAAAKLSPAEKWASLPQNLQNQLIKNLTNYTLQMEDKTTFKEEFVTAGGVDTASLHNENCMHKALQNLFVIGEALNVDGITGGYNFQNAWTTGFVVAQYLNNKS